MCVLTARPGPVRAAVCLGLFFDSPREVKAEHLRSYAGFAVDPKSLEAAGTQEWMSSVGLMVKRIPATKAITCDFPYRSHWSFPLSAMRVYPASCKLRTFGEPFKGVASVEIYNPRPPLSKITFAFPYVAPRFVARRSALHSRVPPQRT